MKRDIIYKALLKLSKKEILNMMGYKNTKVFYKEYNEDQMRLPVKKRQKLGKVSRKALTRILTLQLEKANAKA